MTEDHNPRENKSINVSFQLTTLTSDQNSCNFPDINIIDENRRSFFTGIAGEISKIVDSINGYISKLNTS